AANTPVLAPRAISFQARGIPQLLEQLGPAVKCGERTPADVTGDQGEKRRRVHVSYVRDEYDAVALAQTELGSLRRLGDLGERYAGLTQPLEDDASVLGRLQDVDGKV